MSPPNRYSLLEITKTSVHNNVKNKAKVVF